jgi:serine/threonine protein kinase/TolB-like protein
MTGGERWARVDDALQKALALPVSERVQFVQQICGGDTAMRDEIMSLLAHATSADGFLERSTPVRQPLQSGETLGAYQIKGHIGSGGMGEVYRAHDGRLNRDVALKLLPPDIANDERRARFSREARAIAALSHPGIVVIHTVEQHDGYDFLTMEMVDGTSLNHFIVKGGLPLDRLLAVGTQLADAVGAAHECGVVHRDLKPANVMVTSTGRVKVLDFGLAVLRSRRSVEASPAASTGLLTGAGQVMGTLAYMSPEQAEGRDVDHRSDIYSLGVILYELATGARPSVGSASTIAALRPDLPAEFGRLVRRCLAVDRARRFQSALDLRNELEEIEEKRRAPEEPASVSHNRARRVRRWIVAVALAAVVLAVFGVTIMFALKRGPFAPAPPLDNGKFLVTVFHNRTGDASLDRVGVLLADSIAIALPRLPGIQAFRSPTASAGRTDEITDDQSMRALAEAIGAGRVVSGSYYLDGQELRAVVRVTDTRTGQHQFTFDPIRRPREDASTLAALVESRVMGAVAMDVDIGFRGNPNYRASLYEVQLAIRQAEATDDTTTKARLLREALRRDPRDVRVAARLLRPLRTDWLRQAEAVTFLQQFEAYYADFTPYEQAWFRSERAWLRGRWDQYLAAAETQLAISNVMETNVFVADALVRLHRPEVALTHLRRALDIYEKSLRHTPSENFNAPLSLRYLMNIHHEAERYKDQLQEAGRGQELYPTHPSFLNGEAGALVALGLLDGLKNTRRKVDAGGHDAGTYMTYVAQELREHGRPDESRQEAESAVKFYRARVAEDALNPDRPPDNRFALATSLMLAGQAKEAHAILILTKLPTEERREEWLGSLGMAAAQLDRPDEARLAIQKLERLNPPYRRWRPHYERARIWAALGDGENAVSALRSADAQGRDWLTTPIHRDFAFEKIRDYLPFRAYLEPKG